MKTQINYHSGEVVKGLTAMLKALHNLAAHTENKLPSNKLARKQLAEALGVLATFDPSKASEGVEILETCRSGLTTVFIYADDGLPSILAEALNKQIGEIANMLLSLAHQIVTLEKPE
ncbi:hypothetical protein [Vibrio phage D4]|nr:hypothetical protein [Vibrio phage D4]WKV32806.1 hypothetical protein R21Y_45 [Vibrio phage vB_VhaS_R21Y]